MANKYHLGCMICGKKEQFIDAKDIQVSKWRIMAWNVKTADPIVMCNKCEYQPVGITNVKTKTIS